MYQVSRIKINAFSILPGVKNFAQRSQSKKERTQRNLDSWFLILDSTSDILSRAPLSHRSMYQHLPVLFRRKFHASFYLYRQG